MDNTRSNAPKHGLCALAPSSHATKRFCNTIHATSSAVTNRRLWIMGLGIIDFFRTLIYIILFIIAIIVIVAVVGFLIYYLWQIRKEVKRDV